MVLGFQLVQVLNVAHGRSFFDRLSCRLGTRGLHDLDVIEPVGNILLRAGVRTIRGSQLQLQLLDLLLELGNRVLPLLELNLKVGSILFGSGYVLLAFLRADLTDRWGWLTDQQLIDAVTVGQVTPGPVFTTATFIINK